MAQRDQRSAVCRRLFLSFLLAVAAFIAAMQPASARCVRLLQSNGWGSQVVCNNTGGGGGGGGYNYGAMLGAGAAFLGALQDFTDEAQRNQNGGGAPRQSPCRAGYRVISGGGCAPSAAVDCGGGRYCPAGNVCVGGNKCDTPGAIEDVRKMHRDWANQQQDKKAAALAELDDIKRRLAQPQMQMSEPQTAALGPKQANPFARSGASAPPEANPFARRPWTGEKDDCKNASRLETNTAAWFDMCGADADKKKEAAYTPSIDPQQLTLRAKQGCGGLMSADERTCVLKNKLAILLKDDPAVREKCISLEGKDLTRCVDYTYLYGPKGPTGAELKAILRGTLATLDDGTPAAPQEKYPGVIAASAPPSECGPGFGMKPTPGAFGAWSCQRLGVLFFASDRMTPIDAGSPEAIENVRQFEEDINETAAGATAAALKAVGGTLNEDDRKTCVAASYAAARWVLKGGAPVVPDKCRPMANAAQVALAHFADASVGSAGAGVEELRSSYLAGVDPLTVDEKKPALVGLEPTKEDRQQGECMRRGLAPGCSSAPQTAPSPSPVRAADNCAHAELHWKSAEDMKVLAIYQDHLTRFPTCAFATLAAARIEQLKNK